MRLMKVRRESPSSFAALIKNRHETGLDCLILGNDYEAWPRHVQEDARCARCRRWTPQGRDVAAELSTRSVRSARTFAGERAAVRRKLLRRGRRRPDWCLTGGHRAKSLPDLEAPRVFAVRS